MMKNFITSTLIVFACASPVLAQAPAPTNSSPGVPSSLDTLKGPALPVQKAQDRPTAAPDDRSDWWTPSATPDRFWVHAEYLLWWTKGDSAPPLVTTGPSSPLSPVPGSIQAPGTAVLFGGDAGNANPLSGAQVTAGFWLNDCQTLAVDASFFFLAQNSNNFDASSPGTAGSALLARPFFDTSTGTQNSELVGYPGLASGSVHIHSTSGGLLGAQVNLLCNLCCSSPAPCNTCDAPACGSCPPPCNACAASSGYYAVDFLAGFRFMRLREGISISEYTQVDPTSPVFAGDNIYGNDQFETTNTFYGAQVGLRAEWWWNHLFVISTGQLSLGDTHQTVDIGGSTTLSTPGGGTTAMTGNLLALPSNIGRYEHDQVSIVPEFDFVVGYQLAKNLSAFAGYTFLYWTNVERPGDAINLNVNSTRVPTTLVAPTGSMDPSFGFQRSTFWAQGVSFGVELQF